MANNSDQNNPSNDKGVTAAGMVEAVTQNVELIVDRVMDSAEEAVVAVQQRLGMRKKPSAKKAAAKPKSSAPKPKAKTAQARAAKPSKMAKVAKSAKAKPRKAAKPSKAIKAKKPKRKR
jgi:hypothetical protein